MPPDKLPSGINALSFTVQTNLSNTSLSGPFGVVPASYDIDNDGIFDACDTCTDTDGDGFGNPGFKGNTCALDNCPNVANPSQNDHDADGAGDACDCFPSGGGDGQVNSDDLVAVVLAWGSCPAPPATCPADVAPVTPKAIGNGAVDADDLTAVILSWGPCP